MIFCGLRSVLRHQRLRRLSPHACCDCGFDFHEGMDVCLLRMLYVVRLISLRGADHSFRRFLPFVECLSGIAKREW